MSGKGWAFAKVAKAAAKDYPEDDRYDYTRDFRLRPVRSIHPMKSIVGKANCGCVYHAEDGIPCPHDLALTHS